MGHVPDGRLASWEDLEEEAGWDALLLGNGLSMNVWPKFDYPSLYERAERLGMTDGLTPEDLALFTAHRTRNFERVLAALSASIVNALAMNLDPSPYLLRYQ